MGLLLLLLLLVLVAVAVVVLDAGAGRCVTERRRAHAGRERTASHNKAAASGAAGAAPEQAGPTRPRGAWLVARRRQPS